ncbi:MAG TPA: type II toxin-antitoxin system prevent-host-death family antitoxin [Arachnia sp.]|jgi:prevent-host-death family protein|nr:type II toxin-antitoxin system prevent-host-death family antitoxin [Arachnia sp.]HMR13434.1 type II toxin-antitoxin system prevent-host-death family antitoxin [Arachnia sp.]
MTTVNVHEAKTHLSRLLEAVVAGESVVIAKAGRPIARLVRVEAEAPARRIGFLAGLGSVPEDFDDLGTDEIVAMFEGS